MMFLVYTDVVRENEHGVIKIHHIPRQYYAKITKKHKGILL